ncbi:STY4199 family HEPN domain-containing protein [Flavobacterium sp.]|jgi:TolB-like protein|uniref:STY4199 family HEPN domain-containing protein n=1 Tax=Flavobacterium sp. TaxID=239 RepID=UPI0037C004D3
MKNIQLINSIQLFLNKVLNHLNTDIEEYNLEVLKREKSKQSTSVLCSKLGLNESMYNEFETALYQFEQYKDDTNKSKIACLRLCLWLETISKSTKIEFSVDFENALNNEELAIKQVRAMELLIRDVVSDQIGGSENIVIKLQTLFKQDVIDKWLKSSDETGILSGTTFSELSNILLDKNIFQSVEDIFSDSNIELSKTTRDSLRLILEDIRVIRNSIAHNKKISKIQIESLNTFYLEISRLIKESKKTKINPDDYLDLSKVNLENFIGNLKEENSKITGELSDIKEQITDVKSDTTQILSESKKSNNKNKLILGSILLVLVMIVGIFYFQTRQTSATEEIGKDLKDVKEVVKGDSEIKNMSSSEDLSVTKELNKRTKNINAKRIAVIYFENTSGDATLDKLKKGIADMMITDLSNINMISIVERDRLEEILKEQKLNNSKDFDPNTASKLGKLLGAEIILTGGYFEMMGSLRVDARFIDVQTGKILKSDGVDGTTSSFFKLQKQLTWKIIKNLDTKVSEEEKSFINKQEKETKISFEDAQKYSEALDYFDKGNLSKSKQILNTLLKKYPNFQSAKQSLSKIK